MIRKEKGITLVALIITIIVLVILAAVSVSTIYNSKIIQYAINGSADYTAQAVKENQILKGSVDIIESGIDKIKDIIGDTGGVLDVLVTEIVLNQTELSITMGDEETLIATILPTNASNKNVTWSSDNDKVAEVDQNGKVTTKQVGTATITATADADETKIATCVITVKKPGKPTDQLAIGAYVSYVPKGASSYTPPADATGSNVKNFTSHTSTSIGFDNKDWRIWDKPNSNQVRLISTKATSIKVKLSVTDGYNNGVGILNETCKAIYSHTDYAQAKSIDMEDIDAIAVGVTKGDASWSYSPPTLRSSPKIYEYENEGTVKRSWQGTSKSMLTWYSSSSSVNCKPTWTRYSYWINKLPNEMNKPYGAMIAQLTGDSLYGSNSSNYWIATRSVHYYSDTVYFQFFQAQTNGMVSGQQQIEIYDDGSRGDQASVRPIVTIDLTKCSIGVTGDGTYDNPYSCEKK